ncbi:Na(+)/H(+) antiporter subunit D [Alteromonas aestuariivivens]|uniref:Na(+)/H(+) antiporter subunit D n=2 Tax=Alteromonas aestuariivivens TaxID=1938339 RepID=A0A3D8M4I7_9ALTE|nr:Na(+)/H(+) antiporter subunit D [Alteromonas aestuariivivens]RDV24657.1 Na(+)/H(+) antiporter subunit D [Alteromonas aestuariivivens]
MWIENLPPFVLFFIAALAAAFLGNRARTVLLFVPLWGAANLYFTSGNSGGVTYQVAGVLLDLYHADKLSLLFGYLFHLAAFLALLYAWHVKDRVQQVAGMLYAGSALGAVFAGDFITLFIFWELLALTSAFLIWARRTRSAVQAANRYLIIQVLSGVLLLTGVILLSQQQQSLQVEYIGLSGTASWLLFLAFGIKCAFPLLHSWLTDAYPQATPTGTVFLSAFTTKVAVYALARTFPGEELLIYIGAVMTCFPIFYAVIENDLRKVLAYSLINQLGFMVCGIGIGTALALNGAVAHAFNDVIFKGLLFMTMGAVLTRVGHVKGSDLGGLYKSMPKTTAFCLIGAASISAFPLFSGFVSKSMVMAAMLETGHDYLWLMLLFASAGVFHHAGIKIPYFAFFAHDSGLKVPEAHTNMLLAMGLAAAVCVTVGCFPSLLYALLPWEQTYRPYDLTHVLTQLQLLFFSALAFVWLNKQGLYPPELRSVNLDVDYLYRRSLPRTAKLVRLYCGNIFHAGVSKAKKNLRRLPSLEDTNSVEATHLTRRMAFLFVVLVIMTALAKLA